MTIIVLSDGFVHTRFTGDRDDVHRTAEAWIKAGFHPGRGYRTLIEKREVTPWHVAP